MTNKTNGVDVIIVEGDADEIAASIPEGADVVVVGVAGTNMALAAVAVAMFGEEAVQLSLAEGDDAFRLDAGADLEFPPIMDEPAFEFPAQQARARFDPAPRSARKRR